MSGHSSRAPNQPGSPLHPMQQGSQVPWHQAASKEALESDAWAACKKRVFPHDMTRLAKAYRGGGGGRAPSSSKEDALLPQGPGGGLQGQNPPSWGSWASLPPSATFEVSRKIKPLSKGFWGGESYDPPPPPPQLPGLFTSHFIRIPNNITKTTAILCAI